MKHAFLVQTASGSLVRKPIDELGPEDELVFDGPAAFASADAFQARIEAEVEAAGGFEQWRERMQRERQNERSEVTKRE